MVDALVVRLLHLHTVQLQSSHMGRREDVGPQHEQILALVDLADEGPDQGLYLLKVLRVETRPLEGIDLTIVRPREQPLPLLTVVINDIREPRAYNDNVLAPPLLHRLVYPPKCKKLLLEQLVLQNTSQIEPILDFWETEVLSHRKIEVLGHSLVVLS